MANHDDKIAETLNLTPVDNKTEVVKVEPADDQKLENDFQYARENLYNIIERGTDALNGIVDLANQSQHPRSFEVVADLVRTLSGANKDLLDIQKKMNRTVNPRSNGVFFLSCCFRSNSFSKFPKDSSQKETDLRILQDCARARFEAEWGRLNAFVSSEKDFDRFRLSLRDSLVSSILLNYSISKTYYLIFGRLILITINL